MLDHKQGSVRGHGRTPEDRVLINKVLRHAIDFILALRHYGLGFHKKPSFPNPYSDNEVLENGKQAYRYFFGPDEGDFGLDKLCEIYGWNAKAFRKRLSNLTQAQAKAMGHLYPGREQLGIQVEKVEEK